MAKRLPEFNKVSNRSFQATYAAAFVLLLFRIGGEVGHTHFNFGTSLINYRGKRRNAGRIVGNS